MNPISGNRIAIVGAGIAGLACATALSYAGRSVTVFDKARGPGGRMSTRRVETVHGTAAFDHGAQYFTARDPAFQEQLRQWQGQGLVAPWPAAAADAWVGTPSMNAPLKQLADELEVRWSTRVASLSHSGSGWHLLGEHLDQSRYACVLVALPAEQAATLLAPVHGPWAARAAATPSLPCWTVMAAFASRLPIASDVLGELPPLGWAARNSAKPRRSGPESWVLQATAAWSQAHLDDEPVEVVAALLGALGARAGIDLPPPLLATAHRWRYARSGSAGAGMFWDPSLRLGVCGDWLLGPRVECAWLSGMRLAAAVMA